MLFFIEPLDEGEGTQHETLRLAHRWAALHNRRNNRTIDDSLSDDDDTYESAAEIIEGVDEPKLFSTGTERLPCQQACRCSGRISTFRFCNID